jgi:DNA-binding NarL/FixJ family response regulator
MEHTLGLHGKKVLSNQEIARKLRLTPGAVSQRKATIQQLLNQEQELSPFG